MDVQREADRCTRGDRTPLCVCATLLRLVFRKHVYGAGMTAPHDLRCVAPQALSTIIMQFVSSQAFDRVAHECGDVQTAASHHHKCTPFIMSPQQLVRVPPCSSTCHFIALGS